MRGWVSSRVDAVVNLIMWPYYLGMTFHMVLWAYRSKKVRVIYRDGSTEKFPQPRNVIESIATWEKFLLMLVAEPDLESELWECDPETGEDIYRLAGPEDEQA